jgi:hypothetical protein
LSGNAAPTDAYAYYSWYWYLTGAGVTTKQPIANGLRLTDTTWQPQTGVCGTSTGIFGVTLRLEVVDSPPIIVTPHYVKPQPPPVVSRSGVAEESIIVSCERVQ